MRVALRVLMLTAVFAGVGWMTARAVMHHAANAGAMQPEVRLSGAMAGLFAGGAVTLIVGIAMVWSRRELGEAGCEQCGEGFGGEAFEVEGFGAAGGAGGEGDGCAGDVEGFGEEGDECGVGAAVGGWGGEGNFQSAVVDAGDGVAAGAGMNAHVEGATAGGGAQREAHAVGALAEDGGADADGGGAFFDGYGEVVGHAHGEFGEGGAEGEVVVAEAAEVLEVGAGGFGIFVEGGDGHEAAGRRWVRGARAGGGWGGLRGRGRAWCLRGRV